MKKRIIIGIVVVLSLIAGAYLIGLGLFHLFWATRTGPKYVFAVNPQPMFLTDNLAYQKAEEVMRKDGYDPTVWRVNPDDRTAAPDGEKDKHLVRNALNPNDGFIMFWGPNYQRRSIDIELNGTQLVCRGVMLP
jgi:hypothetical protein